VKIKLDGGQAAVLSAAEYAAVTSFTFAPGAVLSGALAINGVTFTEAGPGGPFEISHNLNDLLGTLITKHGVAGTLDILTINGSRADTIKVLWDYLDDAYVAGNNYYNLPLNEAFVRLGAEYAEYLDAGGAPLTDVTAKFTADNGDTDSIPQREQSMHDNLLGNISLVSIQGRNFGAALEGELLALVPDDYESRPVYSWDRPDYTDSFLGKVDPAASDDRNGDGIDEQMFYGTLNSNDNFSVVRHEGAGVELALKAKEFGPNGGDYATGFRFFDDEGVLHYNVSAGTSPDNAGRADWSFDYAATVLPQGAEETWTFKLWIDVDETEGVQLVQFPLTVFGGQVQGSPNYGFNTIRGIIETDDSAAGIQPYAFGPGEFDIVLEAYAAGTLMASNRIVVHVEGFGI
jgi:hypothetical protein